MKDLVVVMDIVESNTLAGVSHIILKHLLWTDQKTAKLTIICGNGCALCKPKGIVGSVPGGVSQVGQSETCPICLEIFPSWCLEAVSEENRRYWCYMHEQKKTWFWNLSAFNTIQSVCQIWDEMHQCNLCGWYEVECWYKGLQSDWLVVKLLLLSADLPGVPNELSFLSFDCKVY